MIGAGSRIGAGRRMLAENLRPRSPVAQPSAYTSSGPDLADKPLTDAEDDLLASPLTHQPSSLPDPWSSGLDRSPAHPPEVLVPSSPEDSTGASLTPRLPHIPRLPICGHVAPVFPHPHPS